MTPIDLELCLGGRDLTEPKLAPDARTVAFVASADALSSLIVVPIEGGDEQSIETDVAPRAGRGFGGGCFDWHPSGDAVVFAGTDGALWTQPVSPAGATRRGRTVSPADAGINAQAPVVSPDGATVAWIDDQRAVRAVSLLDGSVRRLDRGDDGFCFDVTWSPDGRRLAWLGWSAPWMPWDESVIVERGLRGHTTRLGAAARQVQQPRFGRDARLYHLSDSGGWLNIARDGGVLVAERFEHGGPTWGLGQRSFAVAPDCSAIALCRNEDGFGRLCVVDLRTMAVDEVARGVHGSLQWSGSSLVALRSGARTTTEIVVYDTATWDRRTLAVGPHPAWAGVELIEPELLTAEATDGARIHSRLYRCPERSARVLCWVHGGPTDQWQVTFMPRIAYWLSRGWNVLVPDHRGSTGHGRDYQQAMAGRWGELDVDDTAAALADVHRRGVGRPETTVAIGASAGGFTVLGLAARHGGLVRAVVVAYPVCDLDALAAASHRFEAHYNDTLVGPASTHAELWRERSPVSFAADIRVPVLALHGSDDPVVPVEQSRALVATITSRGGDAELTVYPGEGHGFRQRIHQRDEYRRVGDFLSRVVDAGAPG